MSLLGPDLLTRIWMGSFELTEWLRRRLQSEVASGLNLSSWSSPFGASFGVPGQGFWMNVNAELIIYGATDPKARLRIAGRDINILKDGTFSFHWSFPDGDYHIPVEGTSPDGTDTRSVLLSFLRRTAISGQVVTPQIEQMRIEGTTANPMFAKLHGISMFLFSAEILLLLSAGAVLPACLSQRQRVVEPRLT